MLNLQIRQIEKFIYIYGNELIYSFSINSGIGYILLEENPGKLSIDQKIRDFYIEAMEKMDMIYYY
jgi:hypothetical protein